MKPRTMIAFMVFWLVAAIAAAALAEPSPHAAHTLEEHLSIAQRGTLACLSRAEGDPNRGAACAGHEGLPEILRRLAAPRNWESATLAEILDPIQVHPSPGQQKVTAALRDAARKLNRRSGCSSLDRAMKQALEKIARGQPESAPSIADVVGANDCAPGAKGDLAGRSLVTVVGPSIYGVRVLVGGERPEYVDLTTDDGYEVSYSVEQGGRKIARSTRAYFAAVPINAPWTVSVLDAGSPVRRAWHMTSPADRLIDASPPTLACLEIDVEGGDTVVLNGAEVPAKSSFVYAPPQNYHLGVLRAQSVAASESIPRRELDETSCYRVKLDLRDHANEVTILGAETGERCPESGYTSQRLLERTTDALAGYDKKVRSFDDWARATRGMREITESLIAMPGREVGAPRGRTGAVDQLGTAGRELVRQTSGTLLNVGLQCTKREGGSFEYVVHAAAINLANVPRDAVKGLDLERAQVKGSATANREEDLSAAIADAVAQVLDLPSVRFMDSPDPQRYSGFIAYDVNVRVPVQIGAVETVFFSGRAVRDDERERVCRNPMAADDSSFMYPYGAQPAHPAREPNKLKLELDPPAPGTYLVEARLGSRGGVSARRCVTIVEARTRIGLDVSALFTVGAPFGAARAEAKVPYLAFLAKVERSWLPPGPFRLWGGITLGYGEAHHARSAPPSWQDLWVSSGKPGSASHVYDAAGQIDLSWVRRSFLSGISFGIEGNPCSPLAWQCSGLQRNLAYLLRFKFLLDIGMFDTRGIPSALGALLADKKPVDFSANVLVQAGFSIDSSFGGFGGPLSLGLEAGYIGFGSGNSKYNQAQSRAELRGITTELRPVLGLFWGWSYGL
jgi:hypothetical protein